MSLSTLPLHEALSGALGSISLSCWLFLLLPQLVENYQNGSAEAVSLPFLFVWFAGDVANLVGAVWAGLVPVIIAIAVYFCVADGVLITQCLYYYGQKQGKKVDEEGEEQPLLLRNEDVRAKGSQIWRNTLSVLGVIAVGAVGWLVAWQSGVWKPTEDNTTDMAAGAQVLGYLSALLYLGARIPQIIKNARSKSCEGLSLLFFILSLMGNLTYGAGILFHSVEKQYFLTNLPWLIGSLGTMFEDITIFAQFRMYARRPQSPTEES